MRLSMNVQFLMMMSTLLGCPLLAAAQEILHHEIHVRIRPEEGVLEGDCTISVSRPAEAGKQIVFDLLDGTVLSVEVDGKAVSDYVYGGDASGKAYELRKLIVSLPPAADSEPLKLRVRYRDDMVSASAINPDDNKPFSLAQINESRGSFCSHIAYYPYVRYGGKSADLYLTVPEDLTAVSSGQLVALSHTEPGWATYHWRSERGSGLLPYPFACHHYQVQSELASDGKTRIEVYFLPEDERFARQKMAILQDVFAFYLEVFGSYPFPKLAVVETDLLEGNIGLAAQSVVMLSKQVWFAKLLDPADLSLSNLPLMVLTDETAHQWNAYKVASPNYLAEGISRYTDSLYMAHRGGEEVLAAHMKLTRQQYLGLLKTGAADVAISDPTVTPALYFIKGALALDMLRAHLGEDEFLDGMRAYFTDDADQVTDLRKFCAAFEKASGAEFWWFFDQWYNRGGHPRLMMSWTSRAEGGDFVAKIRIKQEQSGTPYRLWLPVEIRGSEDDSVRRTVLELGSAEQWFEVRLPFEPKRADLDPEQRMPVEVRATALQQ
jgi:aminopeptidase N